MALVVEQPIATFDLSEIARGDLVYGKHRTWPEGKAGFVTSATEKELIVQYPPGIGNVTNHFRIHIDEEVDDIHTICRRSRPTASKSRTLRKE